LYINCIMLHNFLFIALATVASAFLLPEDLNITHIDERIIGGQEVVKNSWPFMVRVEGVKQDGSGYLCGASLLHENYVVTAAHCVYDGKSPVVGVTLHFGDHNLWKQDNTQTSMKIPMGNIRVHQSYSETTIHNDIALIRLPQRAPISQYVQPLCLASPQTVARYNQGTAIGWGLTRNGQNGGQVSEVLKQVNLPILPNQECRQFGSFNPNIMVCAGNTQGIQMAICSGDSGGPFVINVGGRNALVGISSFVSGYGCVAVGYGVVFVRANGYTQWLQSMMGNSLCVV